MKYKSKRIKMMTFLRKHRSEINEVIRKELDDPKFRINDRERELWVLNNEGLYLWAKAEGVEV